MSEYGPNFFRDRVSWKVAWKIYNIYSGKSLKVGFTDEDEAKDWLDKHQKYSQDDYLVEEMDSDEEQEWLDSPESAIIGRDDDGVDIDDDDDHPGLLGDDGQDDSEFFGDLIDEED